MKQVEDTRTVDMLPGAPKRRGRPATGKALSGAERMRKSREARGLVPLAVELPLDIREALEKYRLGKDVTVSQVIEKLLRTQLLRPR